MEQTVWLLMLDNNDKRFLNLQTPFSIDSMDCAFTGTRIAAGDSINEWLVIYDVLEKRISAGVNISGNWAKGCKFFPDGERLLFVEGDFILRIRDMYKRVELSSARQPYVISGLNVSHDGLQAVCGFWCGNLKIWNASTLEEARTLQWHKGAVTGCCFSCQGDRVISSSEDTTVKIWDAATGKEIRTLEGHVDKVTACDISPDGRRILSGSHDGTLRIWDADTGEVLNVLSGALPQPGELTEERHGLYDISNAEVVNCGFSPDGRHIVSHSNISHLMTITGPRHVHELFTEPKRAGNYSILKIWDAGTCKLINSYTGYRKFCFHPRGEAVYAVE